MSSNRTRTVAARTLSLVAGLVVLALLTVAWSPTAARAATTPDAPECQALTFEPPRCARKFWQGNDGAPVTATVPSAALCEIAGPCFTYRINVADDTPGLSLRVAMTAVMSDLDKVRPWPDFQAKSPEMLFRLELYQPGLTPGNDLPTMAKDNGFIELHGYSVELTTGSQSGEWIARVIPVSVQDMAFNMRAAIEIPNVPQAGLLLYPDLQLNPPFELSFSAVAGSFQPAIPDAVADPSNTCMPEEGIEADDQDWPAPEFCLRFSFGIENAGPGLFEITWMADPDLATRLLEAGGVVPSHRLQRVCDALAATCDYMADRGITTQLHSWHAHDHWLDGWAVELVRIADDDWQLTGKAPAFEGVNPMRKIGFQPAPELIAPWDAFATPVTEAADTSGCAEMGGGPCGPIVLSPGAGDIYEWNRGGNYVDFPRTPGGAPQPGVYLLRGMADPADQIVEEDETNNHSYALFEVDDAGRITLHQRGYGLDPWDNHNVVALFAP